MKALRKKKEEIKRSIVYIENSGQREERVGEKKRGSDGKIYKNECRERKRERESVSCLHNTRTQQ